VITVRFDHVRFEAKTHEKPEFDVGLRGGTDAVEFAGILSFLDQLRAFIPEDGFSDPPALEVTEEGITTGYSLGLPPIGIGVFSLTDVRLGAGLELPFVAGKPRLRFNFCERDHPCMLTVAMLGGGGFLGIAVGLDGIEMIEAALDFGGAFCLSIVVATGSVSVIAGVYFRYDDPSKKTELDGFLRINGAVCVLGLISVSVSFDLEFGYVAKGGGGYLIQGEATLVVKIHIALWGISVPLTVRRTFGSSAGDPTFKELMPKAKDWADYAGAFAAT
jgi:hypothetical protein